MKEVEFLPLLKAMSHQMASRRLLHGYGVTDEMIDAAAKRGEVVLGGSGGSFESVMLTMHGADLYP